MLITLIVLGVMALAVIVVLALACGIFYGDGRSRAQWIHHQYKENARRERELHLWQDKALQLRGAGPLVPQEHTGPPTPVRGGRRFVTATQVISDLKNQIDGRVEPSPPQVSDAPVGVPPSIAKKFLKDTAEVVTPN